MVSIIVPVYNAENTIEKCVESIISQQYPCKEIVLINDGSQDKSLEILHRLSEQHSEITVVDKPNGGASSARNAGLAVCAGEFVTFIDSDDYYLSDMYIADMAKLLKENKNIDLAVAGYTVLTGQRRKSVSPQAGVKNIRTVAAEYWSGMKPVMNSPCNKLFRRELIDSTFCEQMTMGEDAVFVLRYLKNCQRVAFCEGSGYGYVFENSSTTADFRKKQPYDMEQSKIYHEAIHEFWTEFLTFEELAENYIRMRTDEAYLMMRSFLSKKGLGAFLKKNITEIFEDRFLCRYKDQIQRIPKSYAHKKLVGPVTDKRTSAAKAYCLIRAFRAKIKA